MMHFRNVGPTKKGLPQKRGHISSYDQSCQSNVDEENYRSSGTLKRSFLEADLLAKMQKKLQDTFVIDGQRTYLRLSIAKHLYMYGIEQTI